MNSFYPTTSPFLAHYDNPFGTDYVTTHRVVKTGDGPRLNIMKHAPQQVVASVVEAEDRAIAAVLSQKPVNHIGYYADGYDGFVLGLYIMYYSNLVAISTMRGCANVILMNPSDVPLLESSPSDALVRLNPHDPQYRWTRYGRFNSFADIMVGEAIPPKRVILLYKGDGPHDAGAILSLHDGVQYLSLIDWDRYSNHLVIP